MRAGLSTLAVAIVAAAAATFFYLRPFEPLVHHWAFAVIATAAGIALLAQAIVGVRAGDATTRFAALGGLGGALLCATMVAAAFAAGPPHALTGSPGQITPARQGSSVAVRFPDLTPEQLRAGIAPDSVDVLDGNAVQTLHIGDTVRVGQYVLNASQGPVALVRATTPDGRPVTITQPQAATFVSPYLFFPGLHGDQRFDFFAVPPLHRSVTVAYYPFYRDETKGIVINTPFVLVQIAEENGNELFRGATISGRPIRKAGVVLTFTLGRYPVVMLSSAPARFPYALGLLLVIAGVFGYIVALARAGMTERRTSAAK
jgi:hypothetical protein